MHSEHPMLKVLHPKQMPAKITCTLKKHSDIPAQEEEKIAPKEVSTTIFKAILVRESNYMNRLEPDQVSEKVFVFKNAGSETWQEGEVVFESANDELKCCIIQDNQKVAPGQEFAITVQVTAPMVKDTSKYC